jgi:4-hydroxy-tetrahydrodipicolinate reductase
MAEKIGLCISGINGRMGQILESLARSDPDRIFGDIVGVDTNIPRPADGLLGVGRLFEAIQQSNVLLIFHNDPNQVVPQAELAIQAKVPVVIGTTGLSNEHIARLSELAAEVPIFQANNFSVGVAVVSRLVCEAAKRLPIEFQPEVVEMHHKGKKDAPSGTANWLAGMICFGRWWPEDNVTVCGRTGVSETVRPDRQVGISSVRAGSIVGDHTVIFAGEGERVEISHFAQSREIFARGALRAAKWTTEQPVKQKKGNKVYNMDDLLGLPPL